MQVWLAFDDMGKAPSPSGPEGRRPDRYLLAVPDGCTKKGVSHSFPLFCSEDEWDFLLGFLKLTAQQRKDLIKKLFTRLSDCGTTKVTARSMRRTAAIWARQQAEFHGSLRSSSVGNHETHGGGAEGTGPPWEEVFLTFARQTSAVCLDDLVENSPFGRGLHHHPSKEALRWQQAVFVACFWFQGSRGGSLFQHQQLFLQPSMALQGFPDGVPVRRAVLFLLEI